MCDAQAVHINVPLCTRQLVSSPKHEHYLFSKFSFIFDLLNIWYAEIITWPELRIVGNPRVAQQPSDAVSITMAAPRISPLLQALSPANTQS